MDSLSPSNGTIIIVRDVPVSWHSMDQGFNPSGLNRTELSIDSGDWIDKGLATEYTFLAVPEGLHTIHVRTFDNAGNMVQRSASIMVDYSPPTVSILSPSNHTSYSVDNVAINWTGTDLGSGIDHYQVSVDSGAGSDVGASTSWSGHLGEGSHIIYVMAVDGSGKVRMAFIDVTIDTEAPRISITNPSQGGFYFSPNVNVTWTSMEYRSGVESYEVKVDGGEWQSSGFAKYSLLTMSEGHHAIFVRATDLVGNSRSTSVNVTLDLNPPSVNFILPAEGTLVNTTVVLFTWNVSDAIGISSISYSIDSEIDHGLMNGVSSASITLTPGSHEFRLIVRDRDGREAIGCVNLTVDTAAPTIAAHAPSSANAGAADKVSFRFSEAVDAAGMSVKVNGQVAVLVRKGNSFNVTLVLVPGTTYTIAIAGAKDMAGNAMQAFSWSFNVVSGDATSGKIVVSGTMVDKDGHPVPGALVTIGDQSATANDQGRFSVYVDPGQHQLRVTAEGMVDYTQTVNADSDQQLGQISMTSVADGSGQNGPSSSGDMTLFLVIGVLVVIVVAAMVLVRKRKG